MKHLPRAWVANVAMALCSRSGLTAWTNKSWEEQREKDKLRERKKLQVSIKIVRQKVNPTHIKENVTYPKTQLLIKKKKNLDTYLRSNSQRFWDVLFFKKAFLRTQYTQAKVHWFDSQECILDLSDKWLLSCSSFEMRIAKSLFNLEPHVKGCEDTRRGIWQKENGVAYKKTNKTNCFSVNQKLCKNFKIANDVCKQKWVWPIPKV